MQENLFTQHIFRVHTQNQILQVEGSNSNLLSCKPFIVFVCVCRTWLRAIRFFVTFGANELNIETVWHNQCYAWRPHMWNRIKPETSNRWATEMNVNEFVCMCVELIILLMVTTLSFSGWRIATLFHTFNTMNGAHFTIYQLLKMQTRRQADKMGQ